MKFHLITRESVAPERLAGMVLCHDVRGDNGSPDGRGLPKGRILDEADVTRLLGLQWDELHVLQMEDGEIHEDEAGERIARAAVGEGVTVGSFSGGHWPLAATRRGMLDVSLDGLRAVNAIDGVCVYTLYSGRIVEAGEGVARAKITPFALEESRVRDAETIARQSGGLVRIRAFLPMRVGAVVQEVLGERAMARFKDALREKVAWFGSDLVEPVFAPPDDGAIAGALQQLVEDGAQVIAVAGTKAMDPLDPAFRALDRLRVPLERHGVPAHPGSLLWIAHLGEVPIIGMPTCGLFSQATVFDLVLPRLLTGERVGRQELVELGHGGYLTKELAFRFPPYRSGKGRGEVE